MLVDVVMPQLGESVVEGTLTKWLVKEGDVVSMGQAIAEVATDKADSEVPTTTAGRISALLIKEGDIIKVGVAMARVDSDATAAAPAAAPAPAPAPAAESSSLPGNNASPSVRQFALQNNIELASVSGTGEHGRVTIEDLQRILDARKAPAPAPAPAAPAPVAAPAPAPVYAPGPQVSAPSLGLSFQPPVPNVGYGAFKVPPYVPKPGDQVIPFSRKRRITADHMVYSKQIAPQVVTVAEVDLHKIVKLREQHKDRYKKEGVSLTLLTFVCAAAVRALRQFPGVNARVVDGATVLLKDVNLGVAVDAPDGLVVPNLKNADELSLRGMARGIGDLATRARDGKLTADDFSGSSFTVTNPGIKGNLFGGAIISQPNVAILRMGEIKKRVVVVEEDGEDRIAIRPVMYMALSYDHRVIDGVLGNSFLWTVADLLHKGEFEP
ncbi:MAG: dihydrolipoamide acetyltransferase family protein [Polyangiaceae bacterium]